VTERLEALRCGATDASWGWGVGEAWGLADELY
jgi:hypothetical protein